jgi:hypothetical protein
MECRMVGGEWWAGGDRWVADRANAMRRVRVTPENVFSEQAGAVMPRSDGSYGVALIPETLLPITEDNDERRQQGATVKYGVIPKPGAQIELTEVVYEVPTQLSPFEFAYGCYELPESQTWAGKAAGDRAFVYSRNNSSPALLAFTDSRQYQPEMLTVTGLP